MSNIRTLDPERFAEVFRALANPHRLGIFLRLARCCRAGESSTADDVGACVAEIGQGLDLAPSTVSHHLKELRRAGLIRMERRGKTVECWVDSRTLETLAVFFRHAGCCPETPDGEPPAPASARDDPP